jgi:hypothetical protein
MASVNSLRERDIQEGIGSSVPERKRVRSLSGTESVFHSAIRFAFQFRAPKSSCRLGSQPLTAQQIALSSAGYGEFLAEITAAGRLERTSGELRPGSLWARQLTGVIVSAGAKDQADR